jgi:hypothetical protein
VSTSTDNSCETAPIPDKPKTGTAYRLPLIEEARRQDKSIRQIGRDLGVDEKTIRNDLETRLLPAEQQAAIQNGAPVEPYLRQAREQKAAEKKRKDAEEARKDREKLVQKHRVRLREEAATGKHSKRLARSAVPWLGGKCIPPAIEQVLEIADRESWMAGDQIGIPREDANEVFETLDCGPTSEEMRDQLDLEYYARVLTSALIALAPEKQIRNAAIKEIKRQLR